MIKIFKSKEELIKAREDIASDLGFVPTMGNLHAGHLSLLEESLKQNDLSIMSIFVNPTQFAEGEDLDKYPRTFEDDLEKTKDLLNNYPGKEVWIYHPESPQDIYPEGFKTIISLDGINKILEGEFRPTHFDGVATVVYLLFKIVQPTRAYFGEKDYQQLIIIKQMTKDLMLDIDIIGLPIAREKSGLALSSRNQYLTSTQREEALKLRRTIISIAELLKTNQFEKAQSYIKEALEDERFNYLSLRHASTLDTAQPNDQEIVIVGTYQLGQTRLLDNEVVKLP